VHIDVSDSLPRDPVSIDKDENLVLARYLHLGLRLEEIKHAGPIRQVAAGRFARCPRMDAYPFKTGPTYRTHKKLSCSKSNPLGGKPGI
jgi:hypothetical protein